MLLPNKTASSQDVFAFLNSRRLPGRLNTTETAVLLGFAEHDMALLVKTKLLKPLGYPAPNAPKYFAAIDIEALARDAGWLNRASSALQKHWKKKNQANPSSIGSIMNESSNSRAA